MSRLWRAYVVGYIVMLSALFLIPYLSDFAFLFFGPSSWLNWLIYGPVSIVLPYFLARLWGKISLLGAIIIFFAFYIIFPFLIAPLLISNEIGDSLGSQPSLLLFQGVETAFTDWYWVTSFIMVALICLVMDIRRHGYFLKLFFAPVILSTFVIAGFLAYRIWPSGFDFWRAIRDHDVETVEQLIEQEVDVNWQTPLEGYSLLSWAIVQQSPWAIVDMLLQAGADVNSQDYSGRTPLYAAVLHEAEPKIVYSLLNAAVDISIHDQSGNSPLYLAAKQGNVDAVQAMLGHDASGIVSRATLHKAAAKGELEAVGVLLDAGVNINSTNRWGTTSLHSATRHGHMSVVKLLLDKGADIYITDKQGDTALNIAIAEGYNDLALSLLIRDIQTPVYDRVKNALGGCIDYDISAMECDFYAGLGRGKVSYPAVLNKGSPIKLPVLQPEMLRNGAHVKVQLWDQQKVLEMQSSDKLKSTIGNISLKVGASTKGAYINHANIGNWNLIFPIKRKGDSLDQDDTLELETVDGNYGRVKIFWRGIGTP